MKRKKILKIINKEVGNDYMVMYSRYENLLQRIQNLEISVSDIHSKLTYLNPSMQEIELVNWIHREQDKREMSKNGNTKETETSPECDKDNDR
jgi:hypothetical protein